MKSTIDQARVFADAQLVPGGVDYFPSWKFGEISSNIYKIH